MFEADIGIVIRPKVGSRYGVNFVPLLPGAVNEQKEYAKATNHLDGRVYLEFFGWSRVLWLAGTAVDQRALIARLDTHPEVTL